MRSLPYIRLFPNKYPTLREGAASSSVESIGIPEDDGSIDHLINDIEYVPIPERVQKSEEFVELAIDYSTLCEIAIEVSQAEDRIIATYYFDFLSDYNPSKNMLAKLIKMSDSIDLCKSKDNETGILKLILSYKTHDHYLKK